MVHIFSLRQGVRVLCWHGLQHFGTASCVYICSLQPCTSVKLDWACCDIEGKTGNIASPVTDHFMPARSSANNKCLQFYLTAMVKKWSKNYNVLLFLHVMDWVWT